MLAASDAEILARAATNDAVVVTADSEFSMMLALSGALRPSVVLLRGCNELTQSAIADLLIANLPTVAGDLASGAIVSLSPSRLAIRTLPIGGAGPTPAESAGLLTTLQGAVLTDCAAAWHEHEGQRSFDAIDLWLSFATRTINVRGARGGQDIAIRAEPVGEGYDMDEYGSVVVESCSPAEIAARIGERLEGFDRLLHTPWGPGSPVGWVLHFTGGSLAIANIADENWVSAWPAALDDARFTELEIAVVNPQGEPADEPTAQ